MGICCDWKQEGGSSWSSPGPAAPPPKRSGWPRWRWRRPTRTAPRRRGAVMWPAWGTGRSRTGCGPWGSMSPGKAWPRGCRRRCPPLGSGQRCACWPAPSPATTACSPLRSRWPYWPAILGARPCPPPALLREPSPRSRACRWPRSPRRATGPPRGPPPQWCR